MWKQILALIIGLFILAALVKPTLMDDISDGVKEATQSPESALGAGKDVAKQPVTVPLVLILLLILAMLL